MEPLNGIFKVAFEIEIESQDDLSLSDLAQALTEGVGEGLVAKISHLDIAKITKRGQKTSSILKIGDMVRVNNVCVAQTNVYSDDGYLFIGTPNEISELVLADQLINVEAGSVGYVNKIDGDHIEVVNVDRPILSFQEIGIDAVNLDLLSIHADLLEKVNSEEDN